MIDPVTIEVIRCKLEAIAADGSRTVIRTAISPAVAESGDCSCTIYNAAGEVIAGGGLVRIHFHVGQNGIRAINSTFGAAIEPGDVFLVNDPYAGGGLHAQDVFIHIPVFSRDVLVAWVGVSAHMMDMGGQVLGSFSPDATECLQEAFRIPTVKLYRAGVEQSDIWRILRNNIRLPAIIEMDMRSLISGGNVAKQQVEHLLAEYGPEVFVSASAALLDLTEAEVRRRIKQIEAGEYSATGGIEWISEIHKIPCKLVVDNGHLIFDFAGSPKQTDNYLNSKPYVIKSLIGCTLAPYLAGDLPFNEGVFRTFDVKCDVGSILDAQAPAPIGAPHLDAGQTAREVATVALNLALAASPQPAVRSNMAGPSSASGGALHSLAGVGVNGQPDGWLMLDAVMTASSAGHDRDATNLTNEFVSQGGVLEFVDTEVLEAWYTIRYEYRHLRRGAVGAGEYNAGRPLSLAYTVSGTPNLTMTLLGNRERFPIAGMAGGLPGAITTVRRRAANDAAFEDVRCHQGRLSLNEGDTISVEASSGGGWGDPFARNVDAVTREVRRGLLTEQEAKNVFGVRVGDPAATLKLRQQLKAKRLAGAERALKPLDWTPELKELSAGPTAPLYPGVEQRGRVAISQISGAPLAVSPDHWVDGCPRIHGFLPSSSEVDVVAYLDPEDGALLAVDVRLKGSGISFTSSPMRWTSPADSPVFAAAS